MNLGQVLAGTSATLYRTTDRGSSQGLLSPRDLGQAIPDFTTDSRDVRFGSLFVAIHGERTDGHLHIEDALRRGALGAIVDHLPTVDLPPGRYVLLTSSPVKAMQDLATQWRSKYDLAVVGVTGSLGKTTVKEAVFQTLAPLGKNAVFKSAGNRNSEVSLPLEILKLTEEHKVAVLEMGMYDKGDIALLCRIARPSVGIVTNVRNNHLGRTGSIHRTAQTKAELVHALPREGLAVLNGDDALVNAMEPASLARTVRYGLNKEQDFVATDIHGRGRLGFETVLRHGSRKLEIKCPTPGAHNAINLLPAAATAHHLGVNWKDIHEALEQFRLQTRACFLDGINGSIILDDRYNASADSTIAALSLLREEPGRHMAILGEMLELGAEEESEHRAVGRQCLGLSSLILLGARTAWIADEARHSGMSSKQIFEVDDNERAIQIAQELLNPRDVLLVKGSRGLQLETIVSALTPGGGTGL